MQFATVMSDYAKAAVAIANETNTLTPEYDILKPLLEETPLRLWGGLAVNFPCFLVIFFLVRQR